MCLCSFSKNAHHLVIIYAGNHDDDLWILPFAA